jgi:membrane complex biogenesis BtpA family protein
MSWSLYSYVLRFRHAFPERVMSLERILGSPKAVIGMVHLEPLPGSPRWAGSMADVSRAALADARALADGGADAILLENFGDVPFSPGRVDAACVAAMAAVAIEIRRVVSLPLGINALRSDAHSALAVAIAVGARFIRVNVHTGAVVTDQGILASGAHDTLRYRRLLGAEIALLADVQTKHAAPLAAVPIEHEARDCVDRGLADGLIVSGEATGLPPKTSDLERVRLAVPGTPLLVGSGASPENAADLFSLADALIVGTSVKRDGVVTNRVDPDRVRAFVRAAGRR